MARPRSIAEIFGKSEDADEYRTSFKFHNNELIRPEANKKNYQKEAAKTFEILAKNGFSKKTQKLTQHLNVELRSVLQLSDIEYLMLTPFICKYQQSMNPGFYAKKIANGDSSILLDLYRSFFKLYDKDYLQVNSAEGDICFSLSARLRGFILFDTDLEKPREKTLKQVIAEVDKIANLYNNFDQISNLANLQIIKIFHENSHYEFCKFMYELSENERFDYLYQLPYYIMGHLILSGRPHFHRDSEYIDMWIAADKKRENVINFLFNDDNNPFFTNKIFDRAIDESGKADKNVVEINSEFKRKYLQDVIREKKKEDLIETDKIVEKTLFFNEDNEASINELSTLLEREKFNEINDRLKSSGTRRGFACLFSGYAGTGKTETVYQIAKKTGRDIIKVDMSSIRSKWWGEDEKNIKAVFSNYKSALQEAKIEPILLLNEADAIIGKRLDVTGNNGAIITSINATQNIILDELETFEGILIATTNLTENMDSAFERRFLYKIEFEKPNLENRTKIWQHMLKLEEDDARELAKKYDEFTGAQIENIFRKKEVNEILYGNNYDMETIRKYCEDENSLEKQITIGFGTR